MNNHSSNLKHLIETEYDQIEGIVVLKSGKKVYEDYFDGFTSENTVHIMSVTKSIMSALVGIAIDKSYIKSVDQKVLEFFPDYTIKRGEKTIQNVTIKNMLTMTAPYKYKSEPYTKVYTSNDWTKAALDLLGGKAGITGEFKYSTVGTQILSGILTTATGKQVIDFASEHLFQPLDIKTPQNTIIHNKEEHFAFLKDKHVNGWIMDPAGINTAGWGLCLTPGDLAKIGQLYLNGGLYDGRRILSSEWIEESTREKSHWGKLSYGFLWWIIDLMGNHCYAAIGDCGNIIFVYPERFMVVAITSRFIQRPNAIMDLITDHIVPWFE